VLQQLETLPDITTKVNGTAD